MQTLGLTTTTIAATDAGAESATQSAAAASNPGGAIFDILMAAATTPQADAMVNGAETLATPPAAEDASQAFAADMEHMVQALTITADVVANGMAARTIPVREIILTVEAPAAQIAVENALPDLSATAPIPAATPALQILDADPNTNLDPALLLLLPHEGKPEAISSKDHVDIQPVTGTEEIAPTSPVLATPVIEDLIGPQRPSQAEELHGPWRAEIHGPVLNAEQQLITTPVHIALTEAPMSPEPVLHEDMPPPVAPKMTSDIAVPSVGMNAPDHEQDKAVTPNPVRVLTISVSVPQKIDQNTNDEVQTSDDEADLTQAPLDHREATANVLSITPFQPETLPPQMMIIVAADRQLDQPARADRAVADASTDVLEAPHRVWQHMPPVINTTLPTKWVAANEDGQRTPVATAEPSMADEATGPLLPMPQGMVVSERAKMTLRQGLPQADTATIPETNIATHVANSSSRSSANIRDLVKLGVRDIEIVQGTGTEQANNVSPQVQLVQSDGAPAAVRAQLAETSPEGNAPGSADRRAQAHEIRMRAIERQVVAAVRDGADTIRMQLYPPGLGQIVIRLSMDGSRLKMVTKASSAEAADSLRSLEGDLRDALSTGGLELAGFDVSDEGERDDPRRGASAEAEETKNNSRSAKSENFALDMNA